MVKKRYRLAVAVVVVSSLLLAANSVSARGWNWIQRLPVSQFTLEDTQIFHDSITRALDNGADGETLNWGNPETGAAGSITPLSSETVDGKPCRNTRFKSRVKDVENISEYFLCKQPDGIWSVDKEPAQ